MKSTIIGTITLLTPHLFTQYSECAAWTDYVACLPQTAELKHDGYWVFASFSGYLQTSSFPGGSRRVGVPAQAYIQANAYGATICQHPLYRVEITHPDFELATVGEYSDGKPMLAVRRKERQVAA